MSKPIRHTKPNQKVGMTKKQTAHIIAQCKQELKDRYIDADVFTYEVYTPSSVYGGDMAYIDVLVCKDGDRFYEFGEIYIDDDFNILQYSLHFS